MINLYALLWISWHISLTENEWTRFRKCLDLKSIFCIFLRDFGNDSKQFESKFEPAKCTTILAFTNWDTKMLKKYFMYTSMIKIRLIQYLLPLILYALVWIVHRVTGHISVQHEVHKKRTGKHVSNFRFPFNFLNDNRQYLYGYYSRKTYKDKYFRCIFSKQCNITRYSAFL